MDGYVENGTEFLFAIKQMGLADHDEEAVKAIDSIVDTLNRELRSKSMNELRRRRIMYFAGAAHGIYIAGIASKMKLREMRTNEGLDPETGNVVKTPEN